MINSIEDGTPDPRWPHAEVERASDLEFDFGPPLLSCPQTLCDRWRTEHVERERGVRADVYRSLGLM